MSGQCTKSTPKTQKQKNIPWDAKNTQICKTSYNFTVWPLLVLFDPYWSLRCFSLCKHSLGFRITEISVPSPCPLPQVLCLTTCALACLCVSLPSASWRNLSVELLHRGKVCATDSCWHILIGINLFQTKYFNIEKLIVLNWISFYFALSF